MGFFYVSTDTYTIKLYLRSIDKSEKEKKIRRISFRWSASAEAKVILRVWTRSSQVEYSQLAQIDRTTFSTSWQSARLKDRLTLSFKLCKSSRTIRFFSIRLDGYENKLMISIVSTWLEELSYRTSSLRYAFIEVSWIFCVFIAYVCTLKRDETL